MLGWEAIWLSSESHSPTHTARSPNARESSRPASVTSASVRASICGGEAPRAEEGRSSLRQVAAVAEIEATRLRVSIVSCGVCAPCLRASSRACALSA